MKDIDNLRMAIALEIAFQAFAKIHPTNYDMYNRKKFYEDMWNGSLEIDYRHKFWLSGSNRGIALNYRHRAGTGSNWPRRCILRIF